MNIKLYGRFEKDQSKIGRVLELVIWGYLGYALTLCHSQRRLESVRHFLARFYNNIWPV
jgi:hypothetical protein